ncbi:MAG: hypothetical protein O2U61_01930 [Candidatus Bathyarchaeota archaeon]|nr:hypothetical protein [Candidatus Bathyarchaeota archaeon]
MEKNVVDLKDKYVEMEKRIVAKVSEEIQQLQEEAMIELLRVQNQALKEVATFRQGVEAEKERTVLAFQIIELCHHSMGGTFSTKEYNDRIISILSVVISSKESDLTLLILKTLVKTRRLKSRLFAPTVEILVDLLFEALKTSYDSNRKDIYIEALRVLNNLCESSFHKIIHAKLMDATYALNENIQTCYSFMLITEWMKTKLVFGFAEDSELLFRNMLRGFTHYSEDMTELTYNRLLWYSFLNDMEEEYIEKTNHFPFSRNKSDLKLVFDRMTDFFIDVRYSDEQERNYLVERINHFQDFTMVERQSFIGKLASLVEFYQQKERESKPETGNGTSLDSESEVVPLCDREILKEYGYGAAHNGPKQIDRWAALNLAVTEMGLKRVANILAQNINNKKGHRNGSQRFKKSIAKWGRDLEYLKEDYYKNDFQWPAI